MIIKTLKKTKDDRHGRNHCMNQLVLAFWVMERHEIASNVTQNLRVESRLRDL